MGEGRDCEWERKSDGGRNMGNERIRVREEKDKSKEYGESKQVKKSKPQKSNP